MSEVISIIKEQYEGFVYNLDVEEDNTYVVEDEIILHNCVDGVNALAKFSVLYQDK